MSSTTDTQIKNRETICAPATPRGRSALGMVRITGSNAINILSEIFVNSKGQKSGVRRFMHAKAKHGYILDAKEEIVDEVSINLHDECKEHTECCRCPTEHIVSI